MSIIEGIGDEVTHFAIVALVLIIIIVAWITTDIRQSLNEGTVYLLNHRRLTSRSQHLTSYTESITISEGTNNESPTIEEVVITEEAENASNEEVDEDSAEIINAMDNDVSILRRRRLDYLENRNISDEEGTNAREEVMEPSHDVSACGDAQSDADNSNITVKLKYLNDDLKIVNGDLKEHLGDFKRRHFQLELASNKLVRLIFNGQVLQRDNETLQSYGMFDNCVVHCLIHQSRNTLTNESSELNADNSNGLNNNNNGVQRDWDLGNLLIATINFSLCSAWYFRYQYPQLFTVTATVGLVAITGLFSVISFSLYFPDAARSTRPAENTNPLVQRT